MSSKKKFSLTYHDSFDKKHTVHFYRYEYNSLMELIWDRTLEDWGYCKGRAWCGSCQIKIKLTENDLTPVDTEENHCLSNQENRCSSSRLACQLELTQELDGAIIQYLGDA